LLLQERESTIAALRVLEAEEWAAAAEARKRLRDEERQKELARIAQYVLL